MLVGAAACLLSAGCGCRQLGSKAAGSPAVPSFTLYVCNQSPAVTPVDIRVSIDGETVVEGEFEVGNQLAWQEFPLVLAPGKHRIEATTVRGDAALDEWFRVRGGERVYLDYWYYPESHRFATPKQFRFVVRGNRKERGPAFPAR